MPNHALILLGLLYGKGNFADSMAITLTSGWDTDCNAGNLGCLLGIRGGLAALSGGPDWRGPLADRLFLSTADGGSCISDALSEAYRLVNVQSRRCKVLRRSRPKAGRGFIFPMPGSLQGFQVEGKGRLENPHGSGLDFHAGPFEPGETARAGTATFILPGDLSMPGYNLDAAPTLYPGQTVHCRLQAAAENRGTLRAGLYLRYYNAKDQARSTSGPTNASPPGRPPISPGPSPISNGGTDFRNRDRGE